MKKIIMLIILICSIFTSCFNINNDDKSNIDNNINTNKKKKASSNERKKEEINSCPDNDDGITEQIKKMNLDEKIGQMVIAGFEGYSIDNNTQDLIVNNKIGGFILYKRNIKDEQQLIELVKSLKETNANNVVPLFLAIDEEGGRVSRMPDSINKVPSSKAIGKINSKNLSYAVGETIGFLLNDFGINMNFAPVMDINNNPNNQVIGDRSFGKSRTK